jgi:galactose oxidase-like protein
VLVGGHSPIWTGYGATHDFIHGVTANNDKDPSFEVFSPPYLFKGPRPAISGVQSGIAWGSSFSIDTPNASSIGQVVLSRLPSQQHITDSDARTLRLNFSASGSTLNAIAPPSGNVAPPGYYYLFILNKSGVPSVARIVQVGSGSNATPTVNLYGSDNPPPPDASIGASPDPDSSYANQPPPLPIGAAAVGLVAAGAGVPAIRRRRLEGEDAA